MTSQRHCRWWTGILLVAGACASPQAAPRAAGGSVAAVDGAARPPRISVAAFRQLRWLEGRWRGDQPDGNPFFEGYRFENDSTIRSYTYADSVTRVAADSGAIVLRGGEVTTGSERASWAASGLTATRIEFVPRAGARNSFVWEKSSPDSWTATLRWPATADRPAREVVYPMRRLSP